MSLNQHLHGYLRFLERERRTRETIRNYDHYLRRFLSWSGSMTPRDITDKVVQNYEAALRQLRGRRGGLTLTTINYHLIALRNFIKYLDRQNIKTGIKEKIALSKRKKTQHLLLTKNDISKLLGMPHNSKDALVIQKRDVALLELIVATGMKISEMSNLKISDIHLPKRKIEIESYTSRELPITFQAATAIREYLKTRTDKNEFLFIAHDRGKRVRQEYAKPMTTRSIQRAIEKYTRAAALPRITATTLRHNYITRLIKKGADTEELQEKLGYTEEQTARRYY